MKKFILSNETTEKMPLILAFRKQKLFPSNFIARRKEEEKKKVDRFPLIISS